MLILLSLTMTGLNVILVIINSKFLKNKHVSALAQVHTMKYVYWFSFYFYIPELYHTWHHFLPFHMTALEIEILIFNFYLQIFQIADYQIVPNYSFRH